MPRKKKKSSTSSSRTDESGGRQHPEAVNTDNIAVDLLAVRLGKASNKRTRSLVPKVALSEHDAFLLRLTSGQEVMLVRCSADGVTSPNTARAIVGLAEIPSSGSTQRQRQSEAKVRPISSGTIHLTPLVVDLLFDRNEALGSSSVASAAPSNLSPRTPSSSTSSDSKSPFSFKVGGGSESFYSSPSPLRQSSPSSYHTPKKQKLPTDPLWLIPTLSRFGRRLEARLCGEAAKLVVQPINDNDDNHQKRKWKHALQVIQKLVLAHCVGRYVQNAEILHISFQGKPMNLFVEQVVEKKLDQVMTELAQLQIDGDSGGEWGHDEKQVWEAVTSSNELRLYKVGYGTDVECVLMDEENDTRQERNKQSQQPRAVGLSKTYDELRTLLWTPLSRPELFERAGLKPPKGVLLYGPSGVGKTLLAKQITAEFEALYAVEFVNCSSLQSKTAIVGAAERQLTKYFEMQPADRGKLLVFDDVHVICPKRGGPNSGGTDRLAASLLAQMDGISNGEDKRSLVVLAITNNPSLLDPALRRPGRLDTEIEVPLPDEPHTRAEIMKCQIQNLGFLLPDFDEKDWLELGKLAKGFNGADCTLAIKEAVRTALLRQKTEAADLTDDSLHLTLADLRASVRSTKPSAIKSITVEIPQVKWSSIGGMETVKQELREAIEAPLLHQSTFEGLGIPPPRGILLFGPPGCSKTLMARALATEGQMNFLAVKGPELLSKWLGESERALASLFRRARLASPCIIFVDEIDSIASKRGSADSPSSSRMLSQLLTELDGINHTGSAAGNKAHRVVVVGATNRPDLLDTALTRPGRIDRMIYVGVPDSDSRAKIFELSLHGKSCSDDIDIARLASDNVSAGFSGAEVVAICRDAALLALEECNDPLAQIAPKIEMRHLLQAIGSMQRQITPEMLDFYAAYREQTRSL